MKLYYNPMSSPSFKVLVALELMGLSAQLNVLQFDELKKPEILKSNPNGMVPFLDDEGFVLWESNAIIQYLAEKKDPQNLWPKDPKVRADISRWMFWQASHLSPAGSMVVFETLFKKMFNMGAPDAQKIKEGEEKFHRFAAVLDQHLQSRKYLVGEKLSLADLSVAVALLYAEAGKLPLKNYANILAWYGRVSSLDAWKKHAPKLP